MIRWERLASAAVPGEGGELRLMRRGREFAITLGANELMNSRLGGSEAALARLACTRLPDREAARVLVGGLGMGFTLRAALGELGSRARVVVAELVPEVAEWARGPLAEVFGGCLDDPRAELVVEDVRAMVAAARGSWDAILLDVDNGPDGLTRPSNDRLYDEAGLAAARAALAPGGVLAVWSSAPDAPFTRRLRRAGFAVEEAPVRADGRGGGSRHLVWLATAPGGRRAA